MSKHRRATGLNQLGPVHGGPYLYFHVWGQIKGRESSHKSIKLFTSFAASGRRRKPDVTLPRVTFSGAAE